MTTTSTTPEAWAAVVAVIVEPLTDTPVAAVPPIDTVTADARFDPVIVTTVPPSVVPEFGAIPESTGGVPDGPEGELLPPQPDRTVATMRQTAKWGARMCNKSVVCRDRLGRAAALGF